MKQASATRGLHGHTPPHRILIVGAGLSGLYAAWTLQRAGSCLLTVLEARATVGGRIASIDAAGQHLDLSRPAASGFDLGPSWFWPDLQPDLSALIDALALRRFAQHEQGDLLLERSDHTSPLRINGAIGGAPSMRLQGGTGTLVNALVQRLTPGTVLTQHSVTHIRVRDAALEVTAQAPSGAISHWSADRVLLALPPRLAAQRVEFSPALPPDLAARWQATDTWMAPHAKYVAVYSRPFWREAGLSGSARSALGPLGEIHDVSLPGGPAALFGFLGVPARMRQGLHEHTLRQRCREQLARLFGAPAAVPISEGWKDWSLDPYTASEADLNASGHHAAVPPAEATTGPWHGRLLGIGSEWSREFPGYLAGAVDAAQRGVQWVSAAGGCSP